MQRVYELGARRVLVTGTGPMGCVPAEIAMRGRNGQCSVELQRAASLYNPQLIEMINGLNSQLGSDVFTAANAYDMSMDFINNPRAFGTSSPTKLRKSNHDLYVIKLIKQKLSVRIFAGFVTSKIACCGQGPYNGIGLCTELSNLCPNREIYAFWDPFHPSERANRIIVRQILTGTTEYMHPLNLSTIMLLDSKT